MDSAHSADLEALKSRAATVAQVLVSSVDAPQLSDEDEHHLSKVLRVRQGEAISVIDGSGAWRICTWSAGTLSPTEAGGQAIPPQPLVSVAFPPLKGDRTELVVQKLTELGVDEIVLLNAERAVVRWQGDKAVKQMARLGRIATEAAMQSRRVRLPTILEPISVAEAVAGGFVLAQWGGVSISSIGGKVAIGPEGGWAPTELALGREKVTLGPTILRAETAAIAAGTLLCAARPSL